MPDERVDYRPCLVIPYWTDELAPVPPDDGSSRPLPAKVVGYMCPAIHASEYRPGEQLTVSIDVRNHGNGDSPSFVQVSVWWSIPTTGFVVGPNNLVGTTFVSIPPRGSETVSTPPMTGMIPANAGDHICLIARASHYLDPAGATPLPQTNRHWAQRNLTVVTAAGAGPTIVPFMAGNPLREGRDFRIEVQRTPREQLEVLAHALGATPADVNVRAAVRARGRDGHDGEVTVAIPAGEQQPMEVVLEMGARIPSGRFVAVEARQKPSPDDVLASIGIIVVGG